MESKNASEATSKLATEQEWSFLHEISKMLEDGDVFNTKDTTPVVKFQHPKQLMENFDFSIPKAGADSLEVMRWVCEQVIAFSLKTNHPHFHNQLFGAVDPIGLAASWITEALNTSTYTFEVAPVFTLMENEVIQTFCRLFGFPNGDGIFSPGGSISNMYGMTLARYKANPKVKETGMFGMKPLVAFTSEESHYSFKKAAHWLGIGTANLVTVKTDPRGRMLVADLEAKIQATLSENRQPFFVNATAGTTVQGSFDNLDEIANICERYAVWLHVDACLGGSIILSTKHRGLLNGVERVDSLAWNPHKSLGVPLQCSMFLIREKGLLHECNSSQAQYLFQQDKFYDVSFDTGDKSIQCGRKVDVFKFWLMLLARGLDGFERRMDRCMAISQYFAAKCERRDGFRLVLAEEGGPFDYTNVCFFYVPTQMRGVPETEEWWSRLYKVAPAVKERMVLYETLMVGYSPLAHKGIGNFFRMVLSCFPVPEESGMDFILNEIERMGEGIDLSIL